MADDSPEVFYYQTSKTVVTNKRAVLNGVTYAMANVTSVRTRRIGPDRLVPVLLAVVGLGATFVGLFIQQFLIAALGMAVTALAVFLWRSQCPTFVVLLGTSGGETHAQQNRDGQVINAIVGAISQAIVSRR